MTPLILEMAPNICTKRGWAASIWANRSMSGSSGANTHPLRPATGAIRGLTPRFVT